MTGRVHIRSRRPDKTLFVQLTTRKKEYADDSRLRNEKKEKMKARNLSSPDRADALLGLYGLPFVDLPEFGQERATGLLWARVSTPSNIRGNLSHLGLFVAHFDIVVPSLTLGR